MYSPFSITELSAISVFEKTYQNDPITDEFTSYFLLLLYGRVKHCSLLINFFSHLMHCPGHCQCTEDNDKLHEMLGVVEHIQKTDRIKKILTGCVRVTETASLDGEVKFILLELK